MLRIKTFNIMNSIKLFVNNFILRLLETYNNYIDPTIVPTIVPKSINLIHFNNKIIPKLNHNMVSLNFINKNKFRDIVISDSIVKSIINDSHKNIVILDSIEDPMISDVFEDILNEIIEEEILYDYCLQISIIRNDIKSILDLKSKGVKLSLFDSGINPIYHLIRNRNTQTLSAISSFSNFK